jgi:hypothetical protein
MRSPIGAIRVQARGVRLLDSSRIFAPRPAPYPIPIGGSARWNLLTGLAQHICADAAEETADGYNV